MIKCKKCGRMLADEAKFCPYCMTKLIDEEFIDTSKMGLKGGRVRLIAAVTFLCIIMSAVIVFAVERVKDNESDDANDDNKIVELVTDKVKETNTPSAIISPVKKATVAPSQKTTLKPSPKPVSDVPVKDTVEPTPDATTSLVVTQRPTYTPTQKPTSQPTDMPTPQPTKEPYIVKNDFSNVISEQLKKSFGKGIVVITRYDDSRKTMIYTKEKLNGISYNISISGDEDVESISCKLFAKENSTYFYEHPELIDYGILYKQCLCVLQALEQDNKFAKNLKDQIGSISDFKKMMNEYKEDSFSKLDFSFEKNSYKYYGKFGYAKSTLNGTPYYEDFGNKMKEWYTKFNECRQIGKSEYQLSEYGDYGLEMSISTDSELTFEEFRKKVLDNMVTLYQYEVSIEKK